MATPWSRKKTSRCSASVLAQEGVLHQPPPAHVEALAPQDSMGPLEDLCFAGVVLWVVGVALVPRTPWETRCPCASDDQGIRPRDIRYVARVEPEIHTAGQNLVWNQDKTWCSNKIQLQCGMERVGGDGDQRKPREQRSEAEVRTGNLISG